MTDFKLTLDRASFQAGKYTFMAKNSGTFPHAFQIDGPGIEDQGTGDLEPGDTGSVTVTLQKGEYYFYCPVEGHQGKGMEMYVTVT